MPKLNVLIFLILAGCAIFSTGGCGWLRAGGDTVEAIGDGVGHAVEETGDAIGRAASQTEDEIDDALD